MHLDEEWGSGPDGDYEAPINSIDLGDSEACRALAEVYDSIRGDREERSLLAEAGLYRAAKRRT